MQNNKLKKNKINLIKKIRYITKISVIKCKKALEKNNYNLEKSLIYLKKKNINNKNNITKEGIIINKVKNNNVIMIKLLCETDFTAKNKYLNKFANKIINFCFNKKINKLQKINKHFKNKIKYLKTKFNENIIIDNICHLKGKYIKNYLHHNNKIGTIIKIDTKKKKNIEKYMKQICIHITAMNPKYISIKNIPLNIIENEKKKILIYNKKNILKKINKKLKKNILLEQKFLYNNKIKVKNFLRKKNIKIINFYRYKI